MVVTIPSRVFPMPGWSGPIQAHHGDPNAIGGSDLMVPIGANQSVVSITNGTVVYTSTQQTAGLSGGNSVEIKGTDGLYYYYAHLRDAPTIKAGDTVKPGQLLGIAGSSGNASPTAPHLHIGIGHSIQEGVGAYGGLGTGFNALGMLKDLQSRSNIPALATADGQTQVTTTQAAGTIQLNTPVTPPNAGASLQERIRYLAQLLASAGMSADKIAQMVAISLAENGSSDPTAKSSTNDYGLWQINWPTWHTALCSELHICTIEQLTDPLNNAKAAKFVYEKQDFYAWSTFKAGLDKRFTKPVNDALAGFDLNTSGDGTDTSNNDGTNDIANDCPEWVLMDTDIVGNRVRLAMPDLGCVLLKNLQVLIDQVSTDLKQSIWEHTYDWGFNVFFGLIGLLFVLVAAASIAGQNIDPKALMALV